MRITFVFWTKPVVLSSVRLSDSAVGTTISWEAFSANATSLLIKQKVNPEVFPQLLNLLSSYISVREQRVM